MALRAGHWALRGFGIWAVVERESGELVGRVGLQEPEGWPGVELAWLVTRSRWGRGYAPEAGRAPLGLGAGRARHRPRDQPDRRRQPALRRAWRRSSG